MSYRRWNDVVCLLGSECCYWDDLKDAELFWLLFNDVWLDPLFHNFLIHWPKNELWSNFSCNCVWRSWMFLNFCHYQPPRGVFRDLSNIYDEVFCEDRCFWTFFTKKYFCKKIIDVWYKSQICLCPFFAYLIRESLSTITLTVVILLLVFA